MKGDENIMENDYMVRASAAGGQIRAFAVTARGVAEEARKAHNTFPVATAALGRLMCAALMMGDMLKSEKDLITVRVDGDGPLGGIVVTADNSGNVKGYVKNTDVIVPARPDKHLNVGAAVGNGTLTVIRDMGLKEPYVGQVALHSGEIADDLTYYYAESEQVPSSVGLGVLMSKENTVRHAGGFIVQLMPGAEENVISRLEQNIAGLPYVTELLQRGLNPEGMLKEVLYGFDVDMNGRREVHFHCNCSRERVERALMLLPQKELDEIISDGETIELKCEFCNKGYDFSINDLKKIRETVEKSKRKDVE